MATTALGLLHLAGCADAPMRPLVFVANDWAPYVLLEAAGAPNPRLLHVAEMPSSSDSLLALQAGTADAAGLTLDEVLLSREQGVMLTVLAVCDESSGADMLLARPALRSISALRGQRIGVERTALGALVLDSALRRAGMNPGEVTIVNVPANRQLDAWKRGDVDAMVTYGPAARALRAEGAMTLSDSSTMPGMILHVLAARTAVLEPQAAGLRHLLALHFEGLHRWQTEPALGREPIGRRLGLAPQEVHAMFAGLALCPLTRQPAWLSAGRLDSAAAVLARAMKHSGLLHSDLPLGDLADATFLPPGAAA